MAQATNRIDVIVEIDAQGRAAAALTRLHIQVTTLERANASAGHASAAAAAASQRSWGLASLQIAAAAAATVAFAKKSVDASNDAAAAQRQLINASVGVGESFRDNINFAEQFRKEFGLARTEAQRLTGASAIFAQGAGAADQAQLFQRSLADLAASRGLQQSKLVEIVGQLQAGIDEATDRLFGKNPSVIQAEYAKSLGTTLGALTDVQKRYALMEAVIREGSFFSGAAAAKLRDTNGQIELAEARFSDLAARIGDAVVQNGAFNDVLQSTLLLLGQLTDEANSQEILDPAIEAQKAVDSAAGQITTRVRQAATLIYGVGQFFVDAIKTVFTFANEATEFRFLGFDENGEFFTQTRESLASLTRNAQENDAARANSENRLREETVARVERHNQRIIDADAKAAERRKGLAAQTGEQTAKAEAEAAATTREKAEAEAARKQFERQQQALQLLRALRTDAEGIVSDFTRAASDNPFVRIFTEADAAAEKLQKRFALLGNDAIERMRRVNDAARETALLAARLESQFKQNDLTREAGRLRRGLAGFETTATDAARMDVINASIEAAEKIPDFLRQAANLTERRRDFMTPLDREREARFAFQDQLAELARIRASFQFDTAAGRRTAQNAIDERLIGLTGSIDLRQVNDPLVRFARGERAAAFTRQAEAQRQNIRDAFERMRIGQETAEAARRDVEDARRLAARSGAPDADRMRELDKAILARTSQLSDRELTPDLRRARIQSLEREARREAELERAAADEIKAAQEFRTELLTKIDDLTAQVKDKNEHVILDIRNKSNAFVDDDLLGEKPKPAPRKKKGGQGGGSPTGQ